MVRGAADSAHPARVGVCGQQGSALDSQGREVAKVWGRNLWGEPCEEVGGEADGERRDHRVRARPTRRAPPLQIAKV